MFGVVALLCIATMLDIFSLELENSDVSKRDLKNVLYTCNMCACENSV